MKLKSNQHPHVVLHQSVFDRQWRRLVRYANKEAAVRATRHWPRPFVICRADKARAEMDKLNHD